MGEVFPLTFRYVAKQQQQRPPSLCVCVCRGQTQMYLSPCLVSRKHCHFWGRMLTERYGAA